MRSITIVCKIFQLTLSISKNHFYISVKNRLKCDHITYDCDKFPCSGYTIKFFFHVKVFIRTTSIFN